jgi:sodium/bile acid cotransporter 7
MKPSYTNCQNQFFGQVVHNLIPNLTKTVCGKYKVGKLGSVSLLVIIWSTYDSAFSSGALHSVPGSNIAFVVFMSIILFVLFLIIAFYTSKMWLDRPDTVACCYCIPAKSPAIGIPISTVLFAGLTPILQAKLQLPLVLYQGLQILGGTILTTPFQEWVDREERRAAEQRRLTV